jgi:hypothetical protein
MKPAIELGVERIDLSRGEQLALLHRRGPLWPRAQDGMRDHSSPALIGCRRSGRTPS